MSMRIAAALAALVPAPALAQSHWVLPDYRGAPLTAGEPGIGVPLPGATPEEERAGWAWQLRAGLNVAALQCQYDKTLLASNAYNAVLTNHREELAKIYKTLGDYFKRVEGNVKKGQNALDRYGTKTYIGFSSVRAQQNFCQVATAIARTTAFAPRGSFTTVAVERLRELRNSLVPRELYVFNVARPVLRVEYPSWNKKCWDRRGSYNLGCGMFA